ncbi:hypothetical protein HMPREF0023_0873 [Acinetobacter sp. ATCC 27244]|jgi:hypothetical protein|nr:hypothetical protein HMPREF0023_0873 [Acinetobacter sp. ATCC 27244]
MLIKAPSWSFLISLKKSGSRELDQNQSNSFDMLVVQVFPYPPLDQLLQMYKKLMGQDWVNLNYIKIKFKQNRMLLIWFN